MKPLRFNVASHGVHKKIGISCVTDQSWNIEPLQHVRFNTWLPIDMIVRNGLQASIRVQVEVFMWIYDYGR